jgi:hypothetical protein
MPTVAFVATTALVIHYATAARVASLSGQLPAFAGTTVSGETLRSSDLRGKVAILNFWSPG